MGKSNSKQRKPNGAENYERKSKGKRSRDPNRSNWSENDRANAQYVSSVEGKENDPDWYKQIPKLFDDSTKISFYNPTGVPFSIGAKEEEYRYVVPGIMVFDTVITPGTSTDSQSGLNMAAINTFEMVRKAINKPNPDYEANDLEIAAFSKMNVYAQYANLTRLFGLLGKWDAENYYTPRSLCNILYDMDETKYEYAIANLANLRARFNQLVFKSSFIFLPTTFRLMERYAWLFMNVFRDHDTAKSQFYAHRMKGYYIWDETTYETGSAAVWKYFDVPADEVDVIGYYLDCFDECIEALRNSSSIRIMDSDLRKAFENNNGWQLAWVDESYSLEYTVSDEVLMQIENSMVMRSLLRGTSSDRLLTTNNDVTQDVDRNIIIYNPKISIEDDDSGEKTSIVTLANDNFILNMHSETISPDMCMVATRGKFILEPTDVADEYQLIVGSDYINDVRIAQTPSTYNAWYTRIDSQIGPMVAISTELQAAFDWAPALSIWTQEGGWPSLFKYVIEWDNYTSIPNLVLKNLHKVATLSMWYAKDFDSWSQM